MTWRALLVGLLLVAGFAVAAGIGVLLRYEILGTGYLPRGVMALFFLLLLINLLLRRFFPRYALQRTELLAIFMLLAIAAAVPGQEYGQHFYLNILALTYYATPEIVRAENYLDTLNPRLVPSLERQAPVIAWAYEGLPPGQGIPWRPWVVPLLIWTPYIVTFYALLLCWGALLSRRWEEQERLVYPLVQAPLELTEGQPQTVPLLRDWLFWAMFGLGLIPFLTKGLHSYFPSVPDLNLQKDAGPLFGGGPLVAFNYLPLHFYPEMMGIAYLLSLEVAFSIWFFYLLRLGQAALRIALGLRTNHAQFAEMQTAGGYLVLALALLWSARRYLAGIASAAIRQLTEVFSASETKGEGTTAEAKKELGTAATAAERLAFWGIIGSYVFILWWASQIGLAISWAALLIGLFPLVSLVVARVVCEAGMFIYSSPFRLDALLFRLIGVRLIGPVNLTLMTMMSWTQIRGTATQLLPQAFQCFKVASVAKMPRRRTLLALFAAIVLALLVCHVTFPAVIYSYGVFRLGWWPQGSGLGTVNRLVSELRGATRATAEDWIGIVLGGGTTLLLVALRQRFLWWPLHPLGYVAWIGWPTERYWLSIFLGWIVKWGVVRFAGYQAFQRLKPAAYGLILGVCFILTFWIVFHFFVPGPDLVRE